MNTDNSFDKYNLSYDDSNDDLASNEEIKFDNLVNSTLHIVNKNNKKDAKLDKQWSLNKAKKATRNYGY